MIVEDFKDKERYAKEILGAYYFDNLKEIDNEAYENTINSLDFLVNDIVVVMQLQMPLIERNFKSAALDGTNEISLEDFIQFHLNRVEYANTKWRISKFKGKHYLERSYGRHSIRKITEEEVKEINELIDKKKEAYRKELEEFYQTNRDKILVFNIWNDNVL